LLQIERKYSQILRSSHDGELDSSLISKRLVAPLPHRSNLLDGSDTVVGDEDLRLSKVRGPKVSRAESWSQRMGRGTEGKKGGGGRTG